MRCFFVCPTTSVEDERLFSQMSKIHNICTNRLLPENTYNRLKVRLAKIPEEKFDFDLAIRTFIELEVHNSKARNAIYSVL